MMRGEKQPFENIFTTTRWKQNMLCPSLSPLPNRVYPNQTPNHLQHHQHKEERTMSHFEHSEAKTSLDINYWPALSNLSKH